MRATSIELAEESVPVSYNAEGWRDRPHAKDKAEGVVRVLVLGDSFMEAYSVRFEDALSARLEHLTSTAERRVEVINSGVGGYSTLQEYLVFNAFGRAYQPDVVVLAMYLNNDLQENSRELASRRPKIQDQRCDRFWTRRSPNLAGESHRWIMRAPCGATKSICGYGGNR